MIVKAAQAKSVLTAMLSLALASSAAAQNAKPTPAPLTQKPLAGEGGEVYDIGLPRIAANLHDVEQICPQPGACRSPGVVSVHTGAQALRYRFNEAVPWVDSTNHPIMVMGEIAVFRLTGQGSDYKPVFVVSGSAAQGRALKDDEIRVSLTDTGGKPVVRAESGGKAVQFNIVAVAPFGATRMNMCLLKSGRVLRNEQQMPFPLILLTEITNSARDAACQVRGAVYR